MNPSNEPAKLMLGDANDTYAMGADPQYFFIFGGIDLGMNIERNMGHFCTHMKISH